MDIEVEDVSFDYGRKVVLQDLTWRVSPGITGLLGPNGAGKTTLMSLMVTLAEPRTGTVRIGGHDLSRSDGRVSARRLLGFVPQRFALVPAMTVIDTIAYAAWINGIDDGACVSAARAALSLVELGELAGSKVRTLSGGQRQRIGIAAALAHDPAVLILDEPTVGLDPGQRLRLRETIHAISANRTVLLSTHLIEDVAHLCTSVGVLATGRIVFSGPFEELEALADDESPSPFGSPFERAYDNLVRRLGVLS